MLFEYGVRKGDSLKTRGPGCGGSTGGFALEGGNVGAIDGQCPGSVVRSDGTVKDVVVAKKGNEEFFVWATKHSIELASHVGLLDLALGEQFIVVRYGLKERVNGNTVTRWIMSVDIETRRMFGETHDGAVLAVDIEGGGMRRVHSDAADLADVRKGEDVGDRGFVVVDRAQIGEIANHVGILVTTVGDGADDLWSGADVAQQSFVVKNRYGRLGVKKNGPRVDGVIAALCHHDGILNKRCTGCGWSAGC